MKPPGAGSSSGDRGGGAAASDAESCITVDNDRISQTRSFAASYQPADPAITDQRSTVNQRPATSFDLTDTSSCRLLSDCSLTTLSSFTASGVRRFVDTQANSVTATTADDTSCRLRHSTDEKNVGRNVLSDAMIADITGQVSETRLIDDELLQTTTVSERGLRAATRHCNDDTTTTTNTTTTTSTATTTTTSSSSSSSSDVDVFDVESTLPEMNWDQLEEQLRHAVQVEQRAEVSYKSIISVSATRALLCIFCNVSCLRHR